MTTSDNLVTGRLRIGNHERSFTLRKPRRGGAGELPLVIVLHGHSPDASGVMMRAWTSFDAHADEWGIAVAYPDGYRGRARMGTAGASWTPIIQNGTQSARPPCVPAAQWCGPAC